MELTGIGLISCITFSHANPQIYAAGCYNKTIGLYDERMSEVISIIFGQAGGVTHVCLFICDLYSLSLNFQDLEITSSVEVEKIIKLIAGMFEI